MLSEILYPGRNAINQSQANKTALRKVIIGITGASGAILGVRMLETLQSISIETHLVISDSARLTITGETGRTVEQVQALASKNHDFHDLSSPIASGSHQTMGMVIIPCSIKTLSAVANSYSNDLIVRAADVTLKEGRPLILVVRETPLHVGHLRLMSEAAVAGAVIFPPVPAFYTHPLTLDDVINNTVGRILSRMGIENDLFHEWLGSESE